MTYELVLFERAGVNNCRKLRPETTSTRRVGPLVDIGIIYIYKFMQATLSILILLSKPNVRQ